MNPTVFAMIFLLSTLGANELSLLYPHKERIKIQNEEEIEATAKSQKNDWISPLNLSLSSTKSSNIDLSQKAVISFSQDIYRFGGIKYQISYAKANKRYRLTNLKVENESYYQSIYSTVLEIRKLKLQLKQAKYQLKNKELEIRIQKEKYKSGTVDIVLLNQAIMDKNTQLQTMINLQNSMVKYQQELSKITPIAQSKIILPRFKVISKGKFIKDNYALKLSKLQQNLKKSQLNLTKSNYYPKIAVSGEVGYQKTENYGTTQYKDNYHSVGVSISMPIDLNRDATIEAKKLAYMIERSNEMDTKINQEALYTQIMQTVENYQSYQGIIKENLKLYQEILQSTQKGFKVGYKSGFDYKIMQNTYRVNKLEIALYAIYIQQELLKLHYAIERG